MQKAVFLLLCASALAAVGCGRGQQSELEVLYVPSDLAPLANVTVTLSANGRAHTLTAEDFSTTRYGTPHSSLMTLDSDADLSVMVLIEASPRVLLSEGTVHIPIRQDRRYGVTVEIRSTNPSETCLGCQNIQSFALLPPAGTSDDSLFITWGSGPISDPVAF